MILSLVILLYAALCIQLALHVERQTHLLSGKVFMVLTITMPVMLVYYSIQHILDARKP